MREMQDGLPWHDIVRAASGQPKTAVDPVPTPLTQRAIYDPKTGSSVPDAIQPIVAFKYLRVTHDGALFSPIYQIEWQPGKSVKAVCSYYGETNHYGKGTTPSPECLCGIHAVRAEDYRVNVRTQVGGARYAVVALYLWGKVANHANGYRAEFAEVAYVITSDKNVKRKWTAAGVPVYDISKSAYRPSNAESDKILANAAMAANERYLDGTWTPSPHYPGGSAPGPDYSAGLYSRYGYGYYGYTYSYAGGTGVLPGSASFTGTVSPPGTNPLDNNIAITALKGYYKNKPEPYIGYTVSIDYGSSVLKYVYRGGATGWQAVNG